MKPLWISLFPLFLAISIIAFPTIRNAINRPVLTTHAAGHSIKAKVEGVRSVETHPSRTVISSAAGEVTIEKSRALLDGAHWATLPENASVEITLTRSRRTLSTTLKQGQRTITTSTETTR